MLVVDITELLRNPIRTGIQRVTRQLLAHWPADVPVRIVRFDPAVGFHEVMPQLADYCASQSADPHFDLDEARAVIGDCLRSSPPVRVEPQAGDRVLIPELFAGLERLGFYGKLQRAGVDLFPIVYDFLAWTSPDVLDISCVGGLNDYLAMLRGAKSRSFISSSVRDEYYSRFCRQPPTDDPVMPLGADSLTRPHAAPRAEAPYWVCVGAFDGRKRQDVVYDAFMASRASEQLDLVFAGKVPSVPRQSMLAVLASAHPHVSIFDDVDDTKLASLISGAQVSFFISREEGFGLPAVESLYLGTPVVVDADLPAVSDLGTHGQVRLYGDETSELVQAMNMLTEPAHVHRLRSEITSLRLQDWKSYARSVAAWVSA